MYMSSERSRESAHQGTGHYIGQLTPMRTGEIIDL